MLTNWQRFQSLFYPVCIRKSSSELNPSLELFYFRGRYILGTADAIYSDGIKYRPLVTAFSDPSFETVLPGLKSVLVLGTGLGSAVQILDAKGYHPDFTMVELDEVILGWALEFLPRFPSQKLKTVHADAFDFIRSDTGVYDLIIVDIFLGRVVPAQIIQPDFLADCRKRSSPGGRLIFNYMTVDPSMEHKVKAALEAAFTEVSEISFGLNRVYLIRA